MRQPAISQSGTYLERVKEGRNSPAVVKTKLINLRAAKPQALIFVFEGINDKGPYYQWVKRIDATITFEPLVCNGKDGVLSLFDAVRRDANNLEDRVYFFVDRDFDDLRGRTQTDAIFMTQAYSFENYLVTEEVVKELLKIEFHCDGPVENSTIIVKTFINLYEEFLKGIVGINYRLFVARKLEIRTAKPLPDGINKIAEVGLSSVNNFSAPAEVIILENEPDQAKADASKPVFDALDPKTRFRGKFAYLFFLRWLELLAFDRNLPSSNDSQFFKGCTNNQKARVEKMSATTFAAMSEVPIGLADFVSRVSAGQT